MSKLCNRSIPFQLKIFQLFSKNCQSSAQISFFFFYFFPWTSYIYFSRDGKLKVIVRERFECTRIAFRKWRLDIHSETRSRDETGSRIETARVIDRRRCGIGKRKKKEREGKKEKKRRRDPALRVLG